MVTPTEETAHTLRKIAAIEAEAARLGVDVDLAPWRFSASHSGPQAEQLWTLVFRGTTARIHESENWVRVELLATRDGSKLAPVIEWGEEERRPTEARRAIAMYSRAVEFAEHAEAIWNE